MNILNATQKMIVDFAQEEDGAQIVEYGLIIAAVSLALIVSHAIVITSNRPRVFVVFSTPARPMSIRPTASGVTPGPAALAVVPSFAIAVASPLPISIPVAAMTIRSVLVPRWGARA